MKRELHFSVGKEWENRTLLEFLKAKGFSRQNITDIKKTSNGLLVDGRWEYVNYKLKEQEEVTVVIMEEESSEKIVPVDLPFPVVYEDEDIVVVNKPADMPIHPSLNNYENTLGNAAAYYFEQRKEPFVFRCVNRLDRDTTGLTILAKHGFSAGRLNDQMLRREIKREYYAIVEGIILDDAGRIEAPIGRVDGSTIERCVDEKNGEHAITNYRVIKRMKKHTLVALRLETGRTHQIRVHMKRIRHPLIGDFLYNSGNHDMERQALHSRSLDFKHPVIGTLLHFEAYWPEDMRSIITNDDK